MGTHKASVLDVAPLPPPHPQAQDTERVNDDIPCVGGGRTDNPDEVGTGLTDEVDPGWANELHEADVMAAGEDGLSPRPLSEDEVDPGWIDVLDPVWENELLFEADDTMGDDPRDGGDLLGGGLLGGDLLGVYPGSGSLDHLPFGGGGDGSGSMTGLLDGGWGDGDDPMGDDILGMVDDPRDGCDLLGGDAQGVSPGSGSLDHLPFGGGSDARG
jgi:hypothetical protein